MPANFPYADKTTTRRRLPWVVAVSGGHDDFAAKIRENPLRVFGFVLQA